MGPADWQNIADCARKRWEALREALEADPALEFCVDYWNRRDGEFATWQMAQAATGRCPF